MKIKQNFFIVYAKHIDTILGKNNIIIYDNRKYLVNYDDLYHDQKYIYLHVSKSGNITIKDVIIKMSKCNFYIDHLLITICFFRRF